MNARLLLGAALALPLAGLGTSWAVTHVRAQQGTVWQVPVSGYDPRDLLQGHYVQYRYDWPGLDFTSSPEGFYGAPVLCLEGTAPRIAQVRVADGRPCPVPVRADLSDPGMMGPLVGGRLYVPQTAAAGLEQKLANPAQKAILRFRLREDGHLTPLELTFRAKSAAERAAEERLVRPPEPAPPPVRAN